MNQPRFTDSHRYPHGYVPAAATDIRATLARIRERIAAEREQAQKKGKRK